MSLMISFAVARFSIGYDSSGCLVRAQRGAIFGVILVLGYLTLTWLVVCSHVYIHSYWT